MFILFRGVLHVVSYQISFISFHPRRAVQVTCTLNRSQCVHCHRFIELDNGIFQLSFVDGLLGIIWQSKTLRVSIMKETKWFKTEMNGRLFSEKRGIIWGCCDWGGRTLSSQHRCPGLEFQPWWMFFFVLCLSRYFQFITCTELMRS